MSKSNVPKKKTGPHKNPRVPAPIRPFTDAILEIINKNPQMVQDLAQAVVLQAMDGNAPYAKMLWDRIEGPVKEVVESESVVTYRVVREDDPCS